MATRTAVKKFKGQGLSPTIYPGLARTDAVKLAPGTYVAGTVLGQVTGTTAVNDVQTITVSGTPTGGSFRLNFNGQVTAAIAFNAAASAVQTALQALSNVGTGNVTCSGGPFPGATVVCTFAGDQAGIFEPLMTLYSNSLTGGASPTAAVAHTTPGAYAGGFFTNYNDSLSDGTQTARSLLEYDTVVDEYGRHTVGGGEFGEFSLCAPVYITGHFRTADLTGIDAAAVVDLGRLVRGTTLSDVGTILKME